MNFIKWTMNRKSIVKLIFKYIAQPATVKKV
jgi:hypothetical protein